MNRIGDYALIGDCHSAALVGRDGSIDWACFPRFDSPSVFARVLDPDKGGAFQVRVGDSTVTRTYLERTNVLCTRFETSTGVIQVSDCMPAEAVEGRPAGVKGHASILRRIECVEGSGIVDVRIAPRFEYGRVIPAVRLTGEEKAEIVGGADAMHITSSRLLSEEADAVVGRWMLRAGEVAWLDVAWTSSHDRTRAHRPPTIDELERRFNATIEFWRGWLDRCTYEGKHADAVHRSALTLKMLSYAPTGALVAAPTTSLPEHIGGGRNWDYRYTWIRDATLTLIALSGVGYLHEADRFRVWMERTSSGRPKDLQIMYGIGGERFLPELELGHLEGHRGSRPVRIGNGASTQSQLDSYGQLLQAAFMLSLAGGVMRAHDWPFLDGLADIVCECWDAPDHGIWEIRDAPRHFTHSRVNCWAAVDRAIRMTTSRGLQAPQRWISCRDDIADALMADARSRGWFSQSAGADVVDSAVLLVSALGFIDTRDPLMQSTIERVMDALGHPGTPLLHRYVADDGLEGGEGAFLLCSFWLVDCLIFSGRVDEADALVERLLEYANDVGLFSEEADPESGEALGNFPQAFTHMALIASCVHLSNARKGRIPSGAVDYAESAAARL